MVLLGAVGREALSGLTRFGTLNLSDQTAGGRARGVRETRVTNTRKDQP
jgi:hypothetical protein